MANIPQKPPAPLNAQAAPMAASLEELVTRPQPQSGPTRAAPPPQAQPQPQVRAARPAPQAPQFPLAWLFQTTGQKSKIAPVERGMFMLCGVGLWVWGAFLSNLFMQSAFPALKAPNLAAQSVMAGLVVSAIFAVIEFFLPKGNHAPIMWLFLLAIYVLDVVVNIVGYMALFHAAKLGFDTGSFLILLMGCATALLPERLMLKAWER